LEVITVKSSVELKYLAEKEEGSTEDDEYGDKKYDRLDKAPHGLYSDNVCPENDIYAQEFFLHCFSILSIAKKRFYESREGKTYMKKDDHDSLIKRLIS